MTLNLTSLKLFIAAVEEGTISKAAQKEYIAAAAVSHRISELEKDLGIQLLYRTNKGVSPTQAGLDLLYQAKSLLNNIKEIEKQMKDYSKGETGLIRIVTNITAMSHFLPSALLAFKKEHPSIDFKIFEKRSLTIVHDVEERKADIGLYTYLPHDAEIESFPIVKDELIILAPKDHPLAKKEAIYFEDSLDYPHISLFKGTHINYQLKKSALDINKLLTIKAEVSNYETMCSLVNAGLGIAVLPSQTILNYHIPNTTKVKLKNPWAKREIAVAVKQVKKLSPNAKKLLDFFLTNLPLT